jgi:hypothetical protein
MTDYGKTTPVAFPGAPPHRAARVQTVAAARCTRCTPSQWHAPGVEGTEAGTAGRRCISGRRSRGYRRKCGYGIGLEVNRHPSRVNPEAGAALRPSGQVLDLLLHSDAEGAQKRLIRVQLAGAAGKPPNPRPDRKGAVSRPRTATRRLSSGAALAALQPIGASRHPVAIDMSD